MFAILLLSYAHAFSYNATLLDVKPPAEFVVKLSTGEIMSFSPRGVTLPSMSGTCEKAKALRCEKLIESMVSQARKVEIESAEGDRAHIYVDDLPVGRYLVSRKLAAYGQVKDWCKP